MFRSPGAIALQLGPLTIRWYGVLIALAVLVGTTLAQREARRKGLDPEPLMNTIVIGIVAALVGARLYYVAFNWDYYAGNLTKILAVWEGGLAIHGGLLGGLLGGGAYALRRRLPVTHYLDICAPSLILGQAIGRWGNFFNQEAFGTPTDLPWGLFIDPGHRPPALAQFEFFHPTFLYESLWNLLVFTVLVALLRRPLERSPGGLFLAYLGLYSAGRFFIEGLRVDSLMLGPLRAAQVVSLLLVAASGAGLLYLLRAGGPAPRST
ncbi:MAG: prolipoprotein diacylglyceryl transferase [candidate division NC10 bacterium]|nr:prolipoprotein diacylglyceryl transferase [candidate division NC10 bacterium]